MLRAALVFLCACPAPAPTPDAPLEDFGSHCMNDGTSPLMSCETPHGFVGWCIGTDPNMQMCRRGCVMNACPAGETPTPILDDCYCQP